MVKNDGRRFGSFQPSKERRLSDNRELVEATYSGSDVFAGAQFASGRPIVVLVAWRRGAAPGPSRAASML